MVGVVKNDLIDQNAEIERLCLVAYINMVDTFDLINIRHYSERAVSVACLVNITLYQCSKFRILKTRDLQVSLGFRSRIISVVVACGDDRAVVLLLKLNNNFPFKS